MLEFDRQLVKRCLKKDRKAQNELHKRCYPVLIPVCWRYAKDQDQAVEYFNLGFTKIIFNLKKYRTSVPFELWCRKVMINTIIDEYRKSKNYRETFELKDREDFPANQRSDSALSEAQEDMLEVIKSKLKKLPPMTSKVFNLYAIDGYKHHEIAVLLDISEGTSQWHYSMAKKRIRELVRETHGEQYFNEKAS